ncbi:cytochrome P450 [Amycolatopsis pigmentata]|uniref:Cytochrome P450 n=1 Tax=Amycolatopsis pigmentata TaxID=450801 RepID=A0ABW5G5E7_9PSEU
MRPLYRDRSLGEMTDLVPLTELNVSADPHAAYTRLREQWGHVAPVELEPGVPAWLVLGYHELVQVSRNDRAFSKNPHNWGLVEVLQNPESTLAGVMAPREHAYHADGDKHRRLRAPLDDGLESLGEHRISRATRAICHELIAKFADRGEADLLAEYALHVPMLAVADWFGIGMDDGQRLMPAILQAFSAGPESPAAFDFIITFLTEHMNSRRENPTDDLTTAFLRHPNHHDDGEVMIAILLALVAGYHASVTWIAQVLRVMLSDSRFGNRVRGGRLGLDDALDEVLWLIPPFANTPGFFALTDIEIGGRLIRKGDAVVLSHVAANIDPRVHSDDPWLAIGNRAHLSWGTGPHSCPAGPQSRIITRVAVDTVLTRLHDLRLAVPADELIAMPSLWAMCPAGLPVRFTGFS